ncbi:MAG: DEAD/DEAH box helicase [Kofleriaceae bacterium]
MSALERMSEVTQAWFAETFTAPTAIQHAGWERIASGDHTLMLAPTGSGKTLAAFLWCVDRIAFRTAFHDAFVAPRALPGYRALYVSPIKALAYDIERNLRAPLIGLARVAAQRALPAPALELDVRTGDTAMAERRRQARRPGDLLITTPESLYLLLTSRARSSLQTIETVIVDEIHALAPTKRGAHLALSLERLSALVTRAGGRDPQRVGLSATQRPLDVVARYLGGDRPVAIVDSGERPRLDLQVVVPVPDMSAPAASAPAPGAAALPPRERGGLWPAIYPRVLELILAHRSTIVFVNSRRLAERLAQQLSELAAAAGLQRDGEEVVRAHHGSVARMERLQIEEDLKAGRLRAICATSSLELGIDMGAVDLVVQLESPGAVARGLQRVGRANHHLGGAPRGRILPKFRGELLEIAAVTSAMLRGEVEEIALPENCLDVLAQQLVAMCATEAWSVPELRAVVRRAASYLALTDAAFTAVLDMLTGSYAAGELAELRPRLAWDRRADRVSARRGAALLAIVNGGTIADRGLYAVHLGERGPRLGELDEEMVYESRPGETFLLGASTWRIEAITRDRVIVSPAPGEPGKMPFWRGDRPGRPVELGRKMGALARRLDDALAAQDVASHAARDGGDGAARDRGDRAASAGSGVRELLARECALDDFAAENLLAYLAEQRAATGTLPSDAAITVERFRDELGDWRVCVLAPLGARVFAPWTLILQRALETRLGYPVQAMHTDDGIALRFADGDALPEDLDLFPAPDDVEPALLEALTSSPRFAGHFRENAARALLLPRRRPGQRTPLWTQRLRSQQLLAVALRFPSFPIVLETYRECLRDVFDVPALVDVLRRVHARAVRVEGALTERPSPFARALAFDYVATFLYEGDAPIAERRAAALALDRELLSELLGEREQRALFAPEVIADLEQALQARAEARRARDPDELHDLLRRLGDLDEGELAERFTDGPGALAAALDALAAAGRVACVQLAGGPRWIATEDAAQYRDGLGVALPDGLPEALRGGPALTDPRADLAADAPAPDDGSSAADPDHASATGGGAATPPAGVAPALLALVARYARGRGPFTLDELCARFALPPPLGSQALGELAARGAIVVGAFRPLAPAGAREHCDADVLRRLRRAALTRARAETAAVPAEAYARFLGHWQGVAEPRRGRVALRQALAHLEGIPLSFAELEAQLLPARVTDYVPAMLDELGATGELVWAGCSALGARDGRVILARREHAAALLPRREPGAELTDKHRAILRHLESAGASFLVAIEDAVLADARPGVARPRAVDRAALPPDDPARPSTVSAALWDLVWAGLVTNDTFAPLRSLGAPTGRRRSARTSFGGRWSLVEPLTATPGRDVERATTTAHRLATLLLDRWGVVSRQAALVDEVPGGLPALAEVLRAMEELGKVRRGFFVEGLAGAQYAWPAAVDALRAQAGAGRAASGSTLAPDDAPPRPAAVLALSALDPANPWGSLLPWPPSVREAARPSRRAGAVVILLDGACMAMVEPRGKRLLTFVGSAPEPLRRALAEGLPQLMRALRRRTLAIESIDGAPALESPLAELLIALGARRDYRALSFEV